jgi:hypothetical protein
VALRNRCVSLVHQPAGRGLRGPATGPGPAHGAD